MTKLLETAFPEQTDFIMLENGEQHGGNQRGSFKPHFYPVVGLDEATLQKSLHVPANPGCVSEDPPPLRMTTFVVLV